MRLNQLAKELEIDRAELLKIMKQVSSTEIHPNEKLPTELVEQLRQQFTSKISPKKGESTEFESPSPVATEIELPATEDISNQEPDLEIKTEDASETPPDEKAEIVAEADQDQDDYEEDQVEVIRAPKLKLEGIKVVGKIELPEPVKKEPDNKENEQESESIKESKPEKRKTKKSAIHSKLKKREPISYQKQLELEETKREKKLERERQKRKELNRKKYESQIAPIAEQSRKKTKKRQIERKQEIQENAKPPVPKNPIKKFWAWLTGVHE